MAKGYESLAEIVKDASKLAAKRAELTQLLFEDRREWALNRAMYKGNQWSFWNPVTSQVETLPTTDGLKARHRVRLYDNKILPGVNFWVAQLVKTKPTIGATPETGSDKDVKAAQFAENLYDDLWESLTLKSKLQTSLTDAALSQGYWKITFDPLAGKPLKFVINPQTGQPITDERLADLFLSEVTDLAKQQGIDPKLVLAKVEQTVMVGEIRVDAIPGENVITDLNAACFEEARFAFCKHAMSPDEVFARFKKEVVPDSAPSEPDIPIMFRKRTEDKPKTTKDVWVGYFRPCPELPKGRYVVWIESPNIILYQSDWPYPFNDLPLVKFPGYERPNSVLDEPVVTHVRPLQKELNRTLSQIVQHKDLTLKPQMLAPAGSLREKLTDEPGAVFQYNPIGGQAPEWREMPGLPPYVFEHLQSIENRINEKFNKIPTERSSLPARVDAGYSIELLQEAVADQISPITNRLEVALARAGKIIALLAQKYYAEPRMLRIKGAGGSVQAKSFMNADLQGGFAFYAEAESGLPKTRAGRQMRIKELVEMQAITPTQALKYIDVADLKGLAGKFQQDEDHALREIDVLIRGAAINPIALQQAQQAVQQGLNPETGQPLQNPQMEIPQILQNAALQPLPYEDMNTHLEVLDGYMKSVEFAALPIDAQQRFITHRQLTLTALQNQAPVDPKLAPRLSISANATTSASVLGEVLRRHGINVTDEQVADEPLETAVYDSVDKPDADSAANDPYTQAEQVQTMVLAQDKHAMDQTKALHDMSLAQQTTDAKVKQMDKPVAAGGGR